MNLQVIEKQEHRSDGALDVVDVFPTIQGEGPFAGVPAVFVRLAGCNLQCPACDTDYTSRRKLASPEEILRTVQMLSHGGRITLVVITGGEPLRQACGLTVRQLVMNGFRVQFETNGTLYDPSMVALYGHKHLSFVCSPKTGKLNGMLERWIHNYKYIISAGKVDAADGLPTESLESSAYPARPFVRDHLYPPVIYVQPCDDKDLVKNKLNTDAAITSCLEHGYKLCLQLHKFAGLP